VIMVLTCTASAYVRAVRGSGELGREGGRVGDYSGGAGSDRMGGQRMVV